ncbi:MAG TPA: nuclear transport factor 2 family protein [Ilumatobacteraceae bacterium]|nr:nuclear transport factor 2 family protein [Ilumatobacteraceae bacterium]
MTDARRAIEGLLVAYVAGIDAGDFAAVGALFEHGEVWDTSGRVARGAEVGERIARFARIYADGTPRTRHLMSNVLIDVDEAADMATSSSSVMVLQAVEGEFPLQPIFVGGYEDEFVRVDGAWRFACRRRRADLVGDLTHHRR